jgi:hypothetical protein
MKLVGRCYAGDMRPNIPIHILTRVAEPRNIAVEAGNNNILKKELLDLPYQYQISSHKIQL